MIQVKASQTCVFLPSKIFLNCDRQFQPTHRALINPRRSKVRNFAGPRPATGWCPWFWEGPRSPASDGWYLVTGGLRGIGLLVAECLARRYVQGGPWARGAFEGSRRRAGVCFFYTNTITRLACQNYLVFSSFLKVVCPPPILLDLSPILDIFLKTTIVVSHPGSGGIERLPPDSPGRGARHLLLLGRSDPTGAQTCSQKLGSNRIFCFYKRCIIRCLFRINIINDHHFSVYLFVGAWDLLSSSQACLPTHCRDHLRQMSPSRMSEVGGWVGR